MVREQVPGPRQRVGGRFVTSEEQRHGLVPQLQVRHATPIALRVLREQQHRQEIAVVGAAAAALLDEAIDGGVETSPRLAKTPRGGNGNTLEAVPERQVEEEIERLERRCERFADFARLLLDV